MFDTIKTNDVEMLMKAMGEKARAASKVLANAPTSQKNQALTEMAQAIRMSEADILTANSLDVEAMKANGQTAAFLDRGTLNAERIEAVAKALEDIVMLEDPVGQLMTGWDRPNGLHIDRVRTPLGVIGVIYESRP
ncbi:MAG: gamma-glutamyl-phosphate reductase, partial [Rhodobacteraceae bacterium]|nr:gamma-glutamyl-phosphate reductase [Paracoccaceae bacterium]